MSDDEIRRRLNPHIGITMDDVVAGAYGLAAGWIVALLL